MAGTKSGAVGIWKDSSIEKSIKLFSNSDQEKNATLVQYSEGKIYAVAEDASLTQLDMNLQVQKVLGQKLEEQIYALVATPDYVALGGENKEVKVHDNKGDLALVSYILLILSLFQEYNHRGCVNSITINEHNIASASGDCSCQVWNIRQKKHLYTVKHDHHVEQVKLFPAGSIFDMISCSWDESVKVWKQEKLVQTLQHSDRCRRFDLNSEGTLLAVGYGSGSNGGVTIWSTTEWKKLADLILGWTVDVRFNSNKILAAHCDARISIVDLE